MSDLDAVMKRVKKYRRLYRDALVEMRSLVEAELAGTGQPFKPDVHKPVARGLRGGTKASQVSTAAEAYLNERETPLSTAELLEGVKRAGLGINQASLSSYLSRSPKFYSKGRRWHLEAWRTAPEGEAADLPTD